MNIQQPVAIPTSTLLVDDLSNLVKILDTYGVAVIPLKKISTGHRNRLLMQTRGQVWMGASHRRVQSMSTGSSILLYSTILHVLYVCDTKTI